MISIAPPLPMSTEVAGEEGSSKVVSQGPVLDDSPFKGEVRRARKMVLLFLV